MRKSRVRHLMVAVTAVSCLTAAVALADVPTPEQIQAQREAAERLKGQAEREAGVVKLEESQLDQLTREANKALEDYDVAMRAHDQAQADVWKAQDELRIAQQQAAATAAQLGRWAANAYRSGTAESGVLARLSMLSSSNTAVMSERTMSMTLVGTNRSALSEAAAEGERRRAAAQVAAQDAAERAKKTADAAQAAKAIADKAVAKQHALVEAARAQQAATQNAAVKAAEDLARLNEAKRKADEAAKQKVAQTNDPRAVTGPVGTCTGKSTAGFGNGQIPTSSLCPLWGAPGHFLRADAAFGFQKLAQAYAMKFGSPLCITDSYRDYNTQVSLYAQKPGLAATPGTSNHGWGRAVDLCGGIDDFGTTSHNWMKANAPAFGWYHPSWAEPGGSRPEPWHWEFAG